MNGVIKWLDLTEVGDKQNFPLTLKMLFGEYFSLVKLTYAPLPNVPIERLVFSKSFREEKLKADVLISNHHLYFADSAIRKEAGFENDFSIFPTILVVFDEAQWYRKGCKRLFFLWSIKICFTKVTVSIFRVSRGSSKSLEAFKYLKLLKTW